MASWRNRIVGSGEAPAASFLANERNFRLHPAEQQNALSAVLEEVGVVQNVIVNKRTDASWGRNRGVETLVDGHARITLALREGDETPVPFIYVDLDPAEEAKVLATLDPLGAMATSDKGKLDELLREVSTGSEALQEMLAELAEKNGVAEHEESETNKRPTVCPECGHEF